MPATTVIHVEPEMLAFVKLLALYVLIAFGIMIAGAASVYIAMVCKGVTGDKVAKILHEADVPRMTTIILIVCAASLLGVLGIVTGDAVISLLSGIAGYVLGNRMAASGKTTPG
jgi:hypothetical protein